MHHRSPLARVVAYAALACAAVLAACSDQATTAPRASADATANAPTSEGRIEALPDDAETEGLGRFPTITGVMARRAEDSLRLSSPQAYADVSSNAVAFPIMYHGGPVMTNANKIVSIYWGPSTIYTNGPTPGTVGSGNNDYSLIGYFLRNIGQTPYWKINQEYRDSQGKGVPNALYYTKYWANPSSPGSTPNDDAIRNMIKSGFYTKYAPDQNTIYLVFSGPGVNLGGGFGTTDGYCAYHNRFRYVNGPFVYIIKYAVMPYGASKPECTANLIETKGPNPDHGADVEVSALAHELAETVTDPQLNAWYDMQTPKQENADKCAWKFGNTYTTANGAKANIKVGVKDFLIQQNWKIGNMINQVGCRMS